MSSRALAFAFVGLTASAVLSQSRTVQWLYYGGDRNFTRYSPLDQINRDNVAKLKIAWRKPAVDPEVMAKHPDLRVNAYLKSTPIMVDGILYVPNALGLTTALDPETGRTRWEQTAFDETEMQGQSARGIDIWRAGDQRLIAVRGEYLYALSPETGKPFTGFGDKGRVRLHRDSPLAAPFRWTSGPIIVKDVIVIAGNGGGGGDSASIRKEAAPEDIRGYDVRTGELRWTFHVVPRPGEFGEDTWDAEFLKMAGDLGSWVPLSADEELGYVYVPLTAPTATYYGGHRKGDNLFASSLVALDAKSGKRVWHFQMVHHDLWEYDNVSPPTLGEITVNGRRIKAVMQASKNGFLFVLDRVTGQPVWPIEERLVPQSTVPGEYTSPTQPFPTKPPAFDRQGVSDDDLIDFTPELRTQAREILKDYVTGPMYTPPSLFSDERKGTYFLPGNWGAGNWHTGAFDPETGIYYAVSHTLPGLYDLVLPTDQKATMKYVAKSRGRVVPTIDGLPLVKPPYGRITALNLNTGEQVWMAANGDGPRHHPLLKHLNLPPLGIPSRPAPLVTKTLLFLGEGSDAITGALEQPWGWGKKFRAYDKATGRVVSEMELPSGTTAAPMTYMVRGKQYIVVAIGDRKSPPEFVALTLP
jgi:quinoprotein glucose dehydrogenase